MKNLEENFISVIVIVHNDELLISTKLNNLYIGLSDRFKYFEIIVVDNYSKNSTTQLLSDISFPITNVSLSSLQSTQQALTAGVEIAIGDYVAEVPDIVYCDVEQIYTLYQTSQKGNDFVFLSPIATPFLSKAFYKLLNRIFINKLNFPFFSSLITMSSRRGINKTSEVSKRNINRNVSYVLTGLKCKSIESDVKYVNRRSLSDNISLMLNA
jgi:glycosyltransferase involved in cell wall biosynthesis